MATVDSKTSIKIDELVNGTVISGTISSSGHLILTTRGGAQIDAGFIAKPFVGPWSTAVAYITGDSVGYAGQTWRALVDNTDQCPAVYTNSWQRVSGSSGDWVERDPYFVGNNINADWEFFWKTGSPTVAYTTVPGEFETGIQAVKIVCPISSTQRFYTREENILRGGEVITAKVRARLLSAAAGARIEANLIQNTLAAPVPLVSSNAYVASNEGPQALTTAWTDYVFTITTGNANPRAIVNFLTSTDAAGSATFLIDHIRITRSSNVALGAWPVGSLFFSITPTDPKILLGGGTWIAWGTGRMPIAVDTNQTEFNTVEKVGGSKSHTHSTTVSSSGSTDTEPAHDHGLGAATTAGVPTGTGGGQRIQGGNTSAGGAHAHTATVSGSGTSGGPNVFPVPYITCYVWKRTA